MKKKVFISYRRDTAEDFARSISQELSDRGCEVFFDHDSLQRKSGEFWKTLKEEVESCDYFLLVISESTFDKRIFTDNSEKINDYVKFEISQALAFKKEIIPVLIHNCKFPTNIPQEVEHVQNYTAVEIKQSYYKQSMNLLYNRLGLSRVKHKKEMLITCLILLILPLLIVGVLHTVFFGTQRYAIESFYTTSETEKQYYDEAFVFAGESEAPLVRIYITSNDAVNPARKLLAEIETVDGEFRFETFGEAWWYGTVLFEIIPCDHSGQELIEFTVIKEMSISRKGALDALLIANDSYSVKRGDSLTIIWTETYYPEGVTYTIEIIPAELYELGAGHVNDSVLYRTDLSAGEYTLSATDTLRIPAGEYVIEVSSDLTGYSGCVDSAYLLIEE